MFVLNMYVMYNRSHIYMRLIRKRILLRHNARRLQKRWHEITSNQFLSPPAPSSSSYEVLPVLSHPALELKLARKVRSQLACA